MELDLTICDASEVVELVKAHERDNTSFGLVISIEGPADGVEGRAPRLTREIGPEWTDRQVILVCNDVETGAGVPEPQLVRTALDHFEKRRSANGVLRVLVHCRRGKSRSTAVGLVLLRHHRGPGTESECLEELIRIRPVAAPNIAIVQHGDALLGCEGALIQAVESHPEVAGRRAEARAARGPHTVMVLWHLGRADEARAQILESISAAERLNKPISLAAALTYASMLYKELREPARVQEAAERLLALAREHQFSGISAFGSVFLGWALAEQGKGGDGVALIRDGLDSMVRAGAAVTALAVLSDAQASAGRFDEALATLEQSLIFAKRSAIELQSVLWRRGELHLHCGNATDAERDFRESLEITRHIGSKGYELRATTSLAQLLTKQDKRAEARAMLSEIYGWFTEGFDTADLKEAKALLDELCTRETK